MDTSIALEILLTNGARDLWLASLMRERLRFLRKAGVRLTTEELRRLVDEILRGPPRAMFPKDFSDADFERLVDREIWQSLSKLRESGADLPSSASARLRTIETAHPDWRLPSDHSDEFPVWMGEVESGTSPSEGFAARLRQGTPEQAADLLITEKVGRIDLMDAWRGLCEERPPTRAIGITRVLVARHYLDPETWRMAFSVFWSRSETGETPEVWGDLARLVAELPDSLLIEISNNLAGWVNASAKKIDQEQEPSFWVVWDRLWSLTGDLTGHVLADRPLFAALNDPRGKLTEGLLFRLAAREPTKGNGIPVELKPRFDRVVTAPGESGILCRVILASRLNYLYLLDRAWTSEHLLSKLDWQSSEAFALWSGYLWAPQSSPELLSAYKDSLVRAVMQSEEFGEQGVNLRRLFAGVCIYTDGILTPAEMTKVMRSFDPKGLADVLSLLSDSLRGAGEKSETLWNERIGPWLKKTWPVAKEKQNERTSVAIAQMVINGGKALPTILEWAQPYLRPTQHIDGVVYRAQENATVDQFPAEMLQLLVWTVPEETPSWLAHLIEKVIQTVQIKAPQLVDSPNYLKLAMIVQQAR